MSDRITLNLVPDGSGVRCLKGCVKQVKKKCYFTVTSLFKNRQKIPRFFAYYQGCLGPYLHAGFYHNYADLQELGTTEKIERKHRFLAWK